MQKRIKSFLISLASFAIASFTALIFTPQWADFINWIGKTSEQTLLGWGIPAVVIIVFGKFIDEIWRQILNKYITSKAGYSKIASASRYAPQKGVDLY